MKKTNFIIELFARLASDNPKFFKVLQVLAVVVMVVTELPDFLQLLSIDVPSWLSAVENKAVTWGALIAAVLAQLPNKDNGNVQLKP